MTQFLYTALYIFLWIEICHLMFLTVHRSIELFHLSTLIHNSLFINNMYVTLFIMSVKHNYILLITPDTGCILLTTCFGHSSTIIRSIRASVFTYILCNWVYLFYVMGSHQFYTVCILDMSLRLKITVNDLIYMDFLKFI
jgi:hypothetical protein